MSCRGISSLRSKSLISVVIQLKIMKLNYPEILEIKFICTGNRSIEVIMEIDNVHYSVEFIAPTKIEIIDGFLEAYWIHIKDLNEIQNNCLEYGRYEIELQSEDTGSVIFNCDDYKMTEI